MRIKPFQGRGRTGALLLCALLIALIGGLTGAHMVQAEAPPAVPYSAIYSQDNPIPQIAQAVRPAVVQVINVLEHWDVNEGATSMDQSYGSGVYIDERGYVVTNYHVIQDADIVEIELLSGERMGCDVVGFDDGTDLAVLKAHDRIDARPVPLGDSDALQIGELVVAIGNPGDSGGVLFGTVTAGIVSALDREDVNAQNFTRRVRVIQTDAAINVGNSGGALLNARGELIGIPTLKLSFDYTTVFEGLGFAIPVNTAKPIVEQLIEKGKVSRPRLGVSVADHDGPNEPLRSHPPAGAQVLQVDPLGAAGQAGVMLYDIITKVDSMRIKTTTELLDEIDRHVEGDVVTLQLYRCYNLLDGSLLPEPETLEVEVQLRIID